MPSAAPRDLHPRLVDARASTLAGSPVVESLANASNVRRMLQISTERLALVDLFGDIVYANPQLVIYLGRCADAVALGEAIGGAGARRLHVLDALTVDSELVDDVEWSSAEIGSTQHTLRVSALACDRAPDRWIALVAVVPTPFRIAAASVQPDSRLTLTRREHGVAQLLALGCTNTEIAEKLAISPFTVRRHTERVFSKLGVRTRAAVGAILRSHTLEP